MAFKPDEFMAQQFQPREAEVALPDLAQWFDGEPVWQVRSLTANEIWRAKSAGLRRDNAQAFVDAIKGKNKSAKSEEFQNLFGLTSDETETEVVIRQEMLAVGSVPSIDISIAVKLGEVHGIYFQLLTDKILELSGQGQEEKKQKASTASTKSKALSS